VRIDALVGSDHDELRRRVLWSVPTPLGVLSTGTGDNVHLMTISWFVPVANDPSQVILSLEKTSRAHALLLGEPVASLSLLHRDDRVLARSFVKHQALDDSDPRRLGVAGALVHHAPNGTVYLANAVSVVSGTAQFVRELSTHALWLLSVTDVGASAELMEGPASQHAVPVLGVHDTRMNYGR